MDVRVVTMVSGVKVDVDFSSSDAVELVTVRSPDVLEAVGQQVKEGKRGLVHSTLTLACRSR